MQRSLSVVVLVSLGAFVSASARAQTVASGPAPARPAAASTSASGSNEKRTDSRLSDEAELSRVVGLYDAGKYRECGEEIERMLDPLGKAPLKQPGIVENARVYWAACLLGAGEGDAADVPLRAAIHENPQMKPPDGLVFPQPVVEHFLKVRDSLISEIRAAEQARIKQAQNEARQRQQTLARDRDRMRALEKLASRETLVVRNRRGFAYVPFGVGQFQNRQNGLGYTLLISESLLGGLGLTAVIVQSRLLTNARAAGDSGKVVKTENYSRLQDDWGVVKRLSLWGFAALAVGGIVEAHLSFVPEFRETRSRPLPPELAPPKPVEVSALPYADATGGGIDVVGRF